MQIYFGVETGVFLGFGVCLSYGQDGLPGTGATNTRFGGALAVGNFNLDEYDDLVIGAPGATVDGVRSGAVTVVYGGENGLEPDSGQLWHLGSEGIPGDPEEGDSFGAALATGDLFLGLVPCDLAIGAPAKDHGTQFDSGMVTVIFGCTAAGLDSVGSLAIDETSFGRELQNQSELGFSLAIGNFDCQGADDLAIGMPGRIDVDSLGHVGRVWAMLGPLSGEPTQNFLWMTGGLAEDTRFGHALATLPQLDGCDGLAIGEPGPSINFATPRDGQVVIARGVRGQGLDRQSLVRYRPAEPSDDTLGWSVAVGQFDDGPIQVAAGAINQAVNGHPSAGVVWVAPSGWIMADGFEDGDFSGWSVVVGAP